jgi:hypothetical protein
MFNHLACTVLPYLLEKQHQPVSPFSRSAHPVRFPGWKLHPLKGPPERIVELTVTGHWQLIFRCHGRANTASDIDLIDHRPGECNAHEEPASSGRTDYD